MPKGSGSPRVSAARVTVVATAPGGTDAPERRTARGPAPASDQERQWRHDMVEQVTQSSLMKRYGTLDEQAAALAFVASPEASYITGTVLPVAGTQEPQLRMRWRL